MVIYDKLSVQNMIHILTITILLLFQFLILYYFFIDIQLKKIVKLFYNNVKM